MAKGGHIDILHLKKLGNCLHSVLKREHSFGSRVSKAASKKRLVFAQILRELITELQALVQLDFSFNLRGHNRHSEHVGEVLS